jgi:UDP:flavonoid glycosyltransferase YjiC (YdhE family)
MSFLLVLALSAFANETHEIDGAVVKSYDAAKHDLVITHGGHDLDLHTETATLHGVPAVGKHVDVIYEGDHAKEVTVH